jgi:hypothetical protein
VKRVNDTRASYQGNAERRDRVSPSVRPHGLSQEVTGRISIKFGIEGLH